VYSDPDYGNKSDDDKDFFIINDGSLPRNTLDANQHVQKRKKLIIQKARH